MLAGCDRLVHPGVDADERTSQRRLIGALLAAPFIAGPVLAVAFASAGPAISLSLLCAAFAAGWAPALTVAMERNAADNIAAFVDAVLASDLDETDKVHVLTAGGTPGSLLHHARSHGADEAIEAFRASVRRSSLPAPVQDLLLQESSRRRRLR